jgi:hypothetical protein
MVVTGTVNRIPLGAAFIAGGVSATAIGWGQTAHPGNAAAFLMFVNVPTVTNARCQQTFGGSINAGSICTLAGVGRGT